MADFVFSGGCRWNALCAVDVKVGADGTPISCKNPITGAEISGGGGDTAAITLSGRPSFTGGVATDLTDLDNSEISEFAFNPTADGSFSIALSDTLVWFIYANESYAVTGDVTEHDWDGTTIYIINGDCTVTAGA